MKILAALFLLVLLLGVAFGVNCWVMICGWGVSPASWGVIIGGFFIGLFLMAGIELVKSAFKD
jgi:hypothetical protein